MQPYRGNDVFLPEVTLQVWRRDADLMDTSLRRRRRFLNLELSNMSSSEPSRLVNTKIEGNCATITLNRPQAYNALNVELADALIEALIACDQDRNVRAVLLTGAGRAFCSGGDIRQMAEHCERDGDAGKVTRGCEVCDPI